ncbi:MAG: GTPase, partial [Desulfurococcales archaeon ex4484_58]
MTITAAFIGPAGSGKTTLISSYSEWLRRQLFMRVAIVNLDPGVEETIYKPLFDIRSIFTLKTIMKKYNLGPNGAFLKSSELLIENLDLIFSSEPFNDLDEWDIVLIDTPGQMETFIFRPASSVFFEKLNKITNIVLVFVLDASAMKTIADAITLWFLSILIQAKTGLTTVPVINKIDIAENVELTRMIVEEPEKLMDLAKKQLSEGFIS